MLFRLSAKILAISGLTIGNFTFSVVLVLIYLNKPSKVANQIVLLFKHILITELLTFGIENTLSLFVKATAPSCVLPRYITPLSSTINCLGRLLNFGLSQNLVISFVLISSL
jgi:hypothetical protein